MDKTDYHYLIFPDFCNGAGYFLNYPAIKKLSNQIKSTQLIDKLDDVYLGMLAFSAGVKLVEDDRFDKGWLRSVRCDIYNVHKPDGVSENFLEYVEKTCVKEKNLYFERSLEYGSFSMNKLTKSNEE